MANELKAGHGSTTPSTPGAGGSGHGSGATRPIDDAISRARTQAEAQAGKRNYIRATIQPNGLTTLQMYLADEPCTWINYDKAQLDGLIDLLRDLRSKMP